MDYKNGTKSPSDVKNSRITRRTAIKAGGIAVTGLIFSSPIINTLRPSPAWAQVSPGPQPSNRPPQFTTAPVTSATAGQAYSYDADATDLDIGDVLTYSLAVAPAGMSIDPSSGLISWTPTSAQVGNNSVSVVATDTGGLSASQTYTLVVASNLAPSITSNPVTAATEGQPYSYDVDATDPEGATLVYTLDTGPAGMSINTASGLISWTPTSAQVGSHSVSVRATDPLGLSASQVYTLVVGPAGGP